MNLGPISSLNGSNSSAERFVVMPFLGLYTRGIATPFVSPFHTLVFCHSSIVFDKADCSSCSTFCNFSKSARPKVFPNSLPDSPNESYEVTSSHSESILDLVLRVSPPEEIESSFGRGRDSRPSVGLILFSLIAIPSMDCLPISINCSSLTFPNGILRIDLVPLRERVLGGSNWSSNSSIGPS